MKKKEVKLFVILDDGKHHSLSWGTSYVDGTKSLPTVTAQQGVQRTAGTWRKFLNFVGRVADSLRRR